VVREFHGGPCNDAPFTWRHFFECFRLREVPVMQLKKPETLADLARALSSFSTNES